MSAPPFSADTAGVIFGIKWRIRKGRKGPNDMVLDFSIGDRWEPVPMELMFFLADFHWQVENILYEGRGRGGSYFLDALKYATKVGWRQASDVLNLEKTLKRLGEAQTSLLDEDAA